MSEHSDSDRFHPAPRARTDRPRSSQAIRENLLDSLDDIEAYLEALTGAGRSALVPRSTSYALATTVIIRVAALFEESRFEVFLHDVPEHVRRAIATTRNIAAHSGYRAMDDELLWATLTRDLPPHLHRWRQRAHE